MKRLLSWLLSTSMAVLAIASYWYQDLIKFVAAYEIIHVVLATFVLIITGGCYLFREGYEDELEELFGKIKELTSNLFLRILNVINFLCISIGLIYGGWVVLGTLGFIVSLGCMVLYSKIRKL